MSEAEAEEMEWSAMQDAGGDFESPYFDWAHDRLFDANTRALIDRIAADPRFSAGWEGVGVVSELAGDRTEQEQRDIQHAAWQVFNLTVGADLTARASALVARAIADPEFEWLPTFNGEDPNDDYFARHSPDQDPRLRVEFEGQLWATNDFAQKQELARTEVEQFAATILQELPRKTRDRLVLVSRNADREALLAPWIGDVSSRRLGWVAYYAQRLAKEADGDTVLDRYSAATKILSARGWSKKSLAQALDISTSRVDSFVDRATGTDLDDCDPLCELVPELRGSGAEWRAATSAQSLQKPKPFSRLTVDERVLLAAESHDPAMLERLARQGSRRISEERVDRHGRIGDVSDDILLAILSTYPSPWMREEMIDAHRRRPLPQRTVLAMAEEDPEVLLHADDDSALRAAALGREEFDAVLAVCDSDVEAMQRILAEDPSSPRMQRLIGLLLELPLGAAMLESADLLKALLHVAERAEDPALAATLRLIACQDRAILDDHIRAGVAGSVQMAPATLVTVALGAYHLSRSQGRGGVRPSALALWSSADLTVEHRLARAAIADRGSDVVTVETAHNIYVATADAIRSFSKSETTAYTYVHMHLTAATEIQFAGGVIRLPSSLPALPYHREMRPHPSDPDGPEVESIVWPMLFQPAIYSLELGLGDPAAFIAVSDGRVAIVDDL